jgi:hypothetical protein
MLRTARRHLHKLSLLHRLSVAQHARADARQTPPLPNEILSPTEARLDEAFAYRFADLRHRRDQALQSERIAGITTQLDNDTRWFADVARDTKSAIWTAHVAFDEDWRIACTHLNSRIKDRADFKREHGLIRDADRPDVIFAVGVLALAFVVETIANAALFAGVSRAGYWGGAQWSALLSLPNILLGVLAGLAGVRSRNHMRPGLRLFGTVVVVCASTIDVLWNLAVAHFRAVAELRVGSGQELHLKDWSQATGLIFTDPGAITASPQAIILLAAGCIVFVVSLYEGAYGFCDPYPGYGRIDRHVQQAASAADHLKSDFYAEITSSTERSVRAIEKRLRAARRSADTAQEALDRAQSINLRFARLAADELWIHTACLRAYHDLNRACRSDTAIPLRFDRPIEPTVTLADYDWRSMRENIRRLLSTAEAAAAATIVMLHDHRLNTIDTIEAHALNGTAPSMRPPPPLVRVIPEGESANA